MNIYASAPVSENPVVYLERWSIRRTSNETMHFVGFDVESCDGRVSTKIMELDVLRRVGMTESGRRYVLLGPAGFDGDADYVWRWVLSTRGISDWTDITPELIPDWRNPQPALRDEATDDDGLPSGAL